MPEGGRHGKPADGRPARHRYGGQGDPRAGDARPEHHRHPAGNEADAAEGNRRDHALSAGTRDHYQRGAARKERQGIPGTGRGLQGPHRALHAYVGDVLARPLVRHQEHQQPHLPH